MIGALREFHLYRDVSGLPNDNTVSKGKIVLGHLNHNNQDEHLDMGERRSALFSRLILTVQLRNFSEHPLADGFDLHVGHVKVSVPCVTPGRDYIVIRESSTSNKCLV